MVTSTTRTLPAGPQARPPAWRDSVRSGGTAEVRAARSFTAASSAPGLESALNEQNVLHTCRLWAWAHSLVAAACALIVWFCSGLSGRTRLEGLLAGVKAAAAIAVSARC
jgi:hypothetical protein